MSEAAAVAGPYTPIVRSGSWLICSGQVGLLDGSLVPGGIGSEMRQAISNLCALLEAEGAGLGDIVKTTVFLADIAAYAEMNAVYVECFGSHRPARSAVAVGGLPLGAAVEIEAWARSSRER